MHIAIKNTFFLFLINVFWGVDSKSAIRFFLPALENPDNLEKNNFFRLILRFSDMKKCAIGVMLL